MVPTFVYEMYQDYLDFKLSIANFKFAISHPFLTIQKGLVNIQDELYYISASICCIAILYGILTEDRKTSMKWLGGTLLFYILIEGITVL